MVDKKGILHFVNKYDRSLIFVATAFVFTVLFYYKTIDAFAKVEKLESKDITIVSSIVELQKQVLIDNTYIQVITENQKIMMTDIKALLKQR